MTRKNNSKSVRLNITELSPISIQRYGNGFKIYNLLFFNYLYFTKFITKLIDRSYGHVNIIEIWQNSNKLKLKIHVNKNVTKPLSNKVLLKVLNYWLYFTSIFDIYLYNNALNLNTAFLLNLYINYLYKSHKYSIRKLTLILVFLLNTKLNYKKIVFAKNGPAILRFKGYKILAKGRFENTKNAMSKTFILIKGSLKLSQISTYIDYNHITLYTKLGVTSIKVWLFFQIVSNEQKNT